MSTAIPPSAANAAVAVRPIAPAQVAPTGNGRPPAQPLTANSPHATDAVAQPQDARALLSLAGSFVHRHIGPSPEEIGRMLAAIGQPSLEALSDAVVPASIRLARPLALPGPRDEEGVLAELRAIADENQVFRSMIGMGYHDTVTPPVILRNILENPGWYTQYTPYQAEIAQGRLEALLNFQTMISDLTGLPLAGASLLDEATAAAEAMSMCLSIAGGHDAARKAFLVSPACHPQTIAVCRTRAQGLGIELRVADVTPESAAAPDLCGVLVQYPDTTGAIADPRPVIAAAHGGGAKVVLATDPLALTLLTPPGELGADIAVGSAQRFGVPMGYGGPHAAFIATRAEHARRMPGRIIGVSRDAHGNPALRMAIQTREQHIRREKATSNICTAQALLAIIASMFAVYHGPAGLRTIALRTHALTRALSRALTAAGHAVLTPDAFDTLRVRPAQRTTARGVLAAARAARINLRDFADGTLGIALDQTTAPQDVADLLGCFGVAHSSADAVAHSLDGLPQEPAWPEPLRRTSPFMSHPVFNTYHSEHELLRYIFRLQGRDLSLAHSMIPLGSCTMKLNATAEMIPVTWPQFGRLHPFAPAEQARGYATLFAQLEGWLAEITGLAAVSLQPNSGSQGEYAGLMVIRAYHQARGHSHRTVCLIPESAHGTNPASAIIAGFRVVPVACDAQGNVDLADLSAKAQQHAGELAALMVTYPSTHGVFEEDIAQICRVVHQHGGQVYMDGANMNAQVGLCRPGDIGADVCHLNLHKTFCIPHGGGGPGMGPIGVAAHLAPFLPGHPVVSPGTAGAQAIGPISAAPYGSPSILTISWVYIALMGAQGLTKATQVAILNANYLAKRLEPHFHILYRGRSGLCAHEFILDARPLQASAGVTVDDIAKRLMDYGFHAPTMSWPVAGTLMIEPTESESTDELDRFADAMIGIHAEAQAIATGASDRLDNPLKNAPHAAHAVTADTWTHPYSRQQAAFPAPWVLGRKFWPPVGRVDNPFGDRNLVCSCPPMSQYEHAPAQR
ncbi:MAG: glycine dehydrogenase (aminomethyl-transferring) [Planctomyces sp.]|nr:glycine dehydrogenase (aminomethyl-transferring) [Planctomyces sp.]